MKQFKSIIIALLAAMVLTGCNAKPENSDIKDNSSIPSTSSGDLLKQEETEAVIKLFANYGSFYTDSFPVNEYNYEIVDKGQTVTVTIDDKSEKVVAVNGTAISGENVDNDAKAYDKTLYKAAQDWTEKLNLLVTENMKKKLSEEQGYLSYNYQGDFYLDPGVGAGGYGMGMSRLLLNSVETPDENTVILNITSVGDKDEWSLEKDIEDKVTVSAVKTADGYRIENCSSEAARFFGFYNEITYGDSVYSLKK